MILNNFAVIEGCDGSGTTTQLNLLEKQFPIQKTSKNTQFRAAEPEAVYGVPSVFTTKEPTGGHIGRLIRRILKGEVTIEKETLARLFAADRGEHLYAPGGIIEHCTRGTLVVSDRYTPSSLVYQGLECGRELAEALNAAFPHPELLIYLDLEPAVALERIGKRKEKQEIYDRLDFQTRVRAAYLELLHGYELAGVRVLLLDAAKPPHELSVEVWSAVCKMPIMEKAKVHEES